MFQIQPCGVPWPPPPQAPILQLPQQCLWTGIRYIFVHRDFKKSILVSAKYWSFDWNCFVFFMFEANPVERPPEDWQCEDHRRKGQQLDGAHAAKASTWHNYTCGNGNRLVVFIISFIYLTVFCVSNLSAFWFLFQEKRTMESRRKAWLKTVQRSGGMKASKPQTSHILW